MSSNTTRLREALETLLVPAAKVDALAFGVAPTGELCGELSYATENARAALALPGDPSRDEASLQSQAAIASPQSPGETGGEPGSCWFVERFPIQAPAQWWAGIDHAAHTGGLHLWTDDPHRALRFDDQETARRAAARYFDGGIWQATEHEFVSVPTAPSADATTGQEQPGSTHHEDCSPAMVLGYLMGRLGIDCADDAEPTTDQIEEALERRDRVSTEALREALKGIVRDGYCNDTCSSQLIGNYPCDCWRARIRAALESEAD